MIGTFFYLQDFRAGNVYEENGANYLMKTSARKSEIAHRGASIEVSRVDSFGEVMSDLHFEAVMDPAASGALQFHVHKGAGFHTTSQIEHDGRIYFPTSISGGLAQEVRFPLPSAQFDSPAKLTESMADFICRFGNMPKEDANLLAAFAISTWFVDCFQLSPVLHLTGLRHRVYFIMRLLACMCRRPILLGRLDLSVLSTTPKGLDPTLFVHGEKLSRNVAQTLDAARYRDVRIPFGKGRLHAYGARVLFSDPMTLDTAALRIHLPSVGGTLPELKDDIERDGRGDFQAKLLRYRMVHYDAVKNSNLDCSAFIAQMQGDVRALITPLIECGDFRESVSSSLRSRSKECSGARFTDLNCLVTEAALAFCHDPSADEFFVKEITELTNAILVGRNEEHIVTMKAVGQALRGLGLFPVRVMDGYHLVLTDSIREKIHRLAEEYDVPSVDDHPRRCDYCKPSNDSVELR